MVVSGDEGTVKYAFVVSPGADPSRIRLACRGAQDVIVDRDGDLQISTPAGIVTDRRPIAFQEAGGARRPVPAAYAPEGARPGEYRYGFRLGSYDPKLTLVIDLTVLVYAGYIGGSGLDDGLDIALDGSGNAYVTGQTSSAQTTFPDGDGFGALRARIPHTTDPPTCSSRR